MYELKDFKEERIFLTYMRKEIAAWAGPSSSLRAGKLPILQRARGGGPRVDVAKCGGLDFLLFVLNLVFILRPLRFMIALAKNLSVQKKTVTALLGRRSSALADPSNAFWLIKSLHFATPIIKCYYITTGHKCQCYIKEM